MNVLDVSIETLYVIAVTKRVTFLLSVCLAYRAVHKVVHKAVHPGVHKAVYKDVHKVVHDIDLPVIISVTVVDIVHHRKVNFTNHTQFR